MSPAFVFLDRNQGDQYTDFVNKLFQNIIFPLQINCQLTMDLSRMLSEISQYVSVPETAMQLLDLHASERVIRKGDHLWEVGKPLSSVGFVNQGLVRCYQISKTGKDHTGQFFSEGMFLTDYFSFITQTPSTLSFQAIETSSIIFLPRELVYHMYDTIPPINTFGRIMAEQNFIMLFGYQEKLRELPPKELYLDFLETRPELVGRVPLQLIASFLRMTPEHLSRIRRRLTVNKSKDEGGEL